MKYTIVIVGGGPIGIACALEAKKHKIDYLVIEKGTLVNSIYNYPVNMNFFSTSERLEIGGVPFVSNNAKPNRSEALEYYRRVTVDNKVNIHLFEEVTDIQNASTIGLDAGVCYDVVTSKSKYRANYIIIATGFYDIPYLLNIPGEHLLKVKHYYKDPHFYAFQKIVVVGAMNSAVDAALETWRKGAEVTMVIRGSEIGTRVKYWVRPDIENRIKEGSVKAYFNSTLARIKEGEVEIKTPQGNITLANDWVLALTGYQPDLPFLNKIGIELSPDQTRKPTYSEASHQTNKKNIFLAGVLCGGMDTHRLFIENSREHAYKIIGHISQQKIAGEAVVKYS